MNRRAFLQGLAALAGLYVFGRAAAQTPYPSKPFHLIVPFTPGGSSDIVGRAIAKALNEAWHQPVIVDNKPARRIPDAEPDRDRALGEGHPRGAYPAGLKGRARSATWDAVHTPARVPHRVR